MAREKPYRVYTDKDKEEALAMLATYSNQLEVSRCLKIPYNTLTYWRSMAEADENGNGDSFAKFRDEKKRELIGTVYENLGNMLADLMQSYFDAKNPTLRDKSTVFGVITDKALALEASIKGQTEVPEAFMEFVRGLKALEK